MTTATKHSEQKETWFLLQNAWFIQCMIQILSWEAYAHSLHVCCESGKSNVQMWPHLEHFLEVHGNRLCLDTEAPIGCYGNAILALHSDNRRTVVCHDTLKKRETDVRKWFQHLIQTVWRD